MSYKRDGKKLYELKKKNWVKMKTQPTSQKKAKRKIANLRAKEQGLFAPHGAGALRASDFAPQLSFWQKIVKQLRTLIDRGRGSKPESQKPTDNIKSPRFGGFKRFIRSARTHEKRPPESRPRGHM